MIIPSENNKTAVLNQIDALHEEHRLNTLRQCALEYKNMYGRNINIDRYGTDALTLICALWMHCIPVPEGLGFGDIVDETFCDYTMSKPIFDEPQSKFHVIMLLQNPLLVRFHIVSGINLVSKIHLAYINVCIQQLSKKDGSRWNHINNLGELREFMLNEQLTNIDLAFLAIKFRYMNIYCENFSLRNIYYFVNGQT